MTKLEHALRLAELGFYVFPILPNVKAPPAVKDWQGWATRDPSEISRYWGTVTQANIGISTSKFGDGQALLVVDVDNKGDKRGDDTITRLELEGYYFPASAEQRTPTGGRHIIYAVSAAVRQGANVLGPGVDIRSRGGYIVGAGSTIGSDAYTLHGDHVTDAPQWLVDRCGTPQAHTAAPVQASGRLVQNVDATAAEQRGAHYLFNEAPQAIEGQGGDETTYKVAARLKDLGCTQQQATLLMLQWNELNVPPWDGDELVRKIANAYRYGKDAPGVAAPEAVFDAVEHISTPDATQKDASTHPFDTINKTSPSSSQAAARTSCGRRKTRRGAAS
jgi:hypothetical protein